MRFLIIFLVSIAAVFATPSMAEAQFFGAKKELIYQKNGLAIQGYDVVEYYDLEKDADPVKGDSEYSHEFNGAIWRFSSAENLAHFIEAPSKFVPAYNGYCAYAASKGYLAKTEPEAWTVVDGVLYFNFNLDVRKTWSQDIPGNIVKSERNWPQLKKKLNSVG